MFLTNFRTLIAGAIAVGCMAFASQADAGWHHHHRGYWGYGYGSCGSSGGSWGSSGGCWGSYGSSGGWYGRYMGGYAGSWGSYGGYGYGSYGGSSGGSSGGYISYGSSGGSSGGWGAPGMIVTPGAAMPGTAAPPAAPAPPAPAPGPGPSEPSPSDKAPADGTTIHSTTSGDSVLLTVKVPAEAKVFVNGHLTTSTGTERQFISRGLVAGSRYTYDVRAEIEVNGKIVSDVKTVSLTAGDAADLAFNLNGETEMQATSPVVTKVTVHVPSGARLFLAGREVPGTGEVREFSTSRLAPGNQWNNYTVRAEAELNGKVVTREQNLSLKAGDSRELSFDFGDEAVASTNSVTAAR